MDTKIVWNKCVVFFDDNDIYHRKYVVLNRNQSVHNYSSNIQLEWILHNGNEYENEYMKEIPQR